MGSLGNLTLPGPTEIAVSSSQQTCHQQDQGHDSVAVADAGDIELLAKQTDAASTMSKVKEVERPRLK